MLVPWGRFPLCHTPIKPISAFPGSDLILRCGLRDHVIMRFASKIKDVETKDESGKYILFYVFDCDIYR